MLKVCAIKMFEVGDEKRVEADHIVVREMIPFTCVALASCWHFSMCSNDGMNSVVL